MLIIVADCTVTYEGRLSTRLRKATRVIMIKDNGSIQVHADHYPATGFKPLNWMTGGKKTQLLISDTQICADRGEEHLRVQLLRVHHRLEMPLGVEPDRWTQGTEKEMQAHLAAHPHLLGPGMQLVKREYPTDVGPVDLLCRDGDGYVVVEIKRAMGHIDGVDQLRRYLESLAHESTLRPLRGLYVAQRFRPNTLNYAARHGIACLPVLVQELRNNVAKQDI